MISQSSSSYTTCSDGSWSTLSSAESRGSRGANAKGLKELHTYLGNLKKNKVTPLQKQFIRTREKRAVQTDFSNVDGDDSSSGNGHGHDGDCRNRSNLSYSGQDILMWGRRIPGDIRNTDIRTEDLCCTPLIKKWLKQLRILAWLLIGNGGVILIALLISGSEFGSSIYFRLSITNNGLAMWLIISCIVQPMLTGGYCFYAISYPKNLRSYSLRSRMYVAIPALFVIASSTCMITLREAILTVLTSILKQYDKESWPQEFWNYVQTQLVGNCSTLNERDAWQRGCFSQIYLASLWIASTLALLAFIQIMFQFGTIILSWRIYTHFEHLLKDGRTTAEICLGPLAFWACKSTQNQFEINDEDILYSFPWLRRNSHPRL